MKIKWAVMAFLACGMTLLLSVAQTSVAQQQTVTAPQSEYHSQHAVSGRPVIDGAVSPHLISDETAVRMFLLAAAEPPDADKAGIIRMRTKLVPIGLKPDDYATLVRAIQSFHVQLQAHKRELERLAAQLRTAPDSTTMAAYVAEHHNLGKSASDIYTSVLARVSADGAEKLRAHIARVKTRIRIIPGPDMPPH